MNSRNEQNIAKPLNSNLLKKKLILEKKKKIYIYIYTMVAQRESSDWFIETRVVSWQSLMPPNEHWAISSDM